jgi:hypothetical protein
MALIDQVITERYALYNGDCVEVVSDLPANSVGLAVFAIFVGVMLAVEYAAGVAGL